VNGNTTITGSLGLTGTRVTKGWFTDLEVTNSIVGSITGNAATVTTNANLTGPITSVGNATAIASQTGTGTTFVMNTSPTLVTPVLGVASATSIDFGGTTLLSSRDLTVDTGGAFNISLSSASGDDFTVDTSKFVVEGDTGNVGVGTASPNHNLVVGDDIGNITSDNALVIGKTGGSSDAKLFLGDASNSYGMINWDASDNDLEFNVNADGSVRSSQLVLDTTGNVGIGINDPLNKVSIGGSNYLSLGEGTGDPISGIKFYDDTTEHYRLSYDGSTGTGNDNVVSFKYIPDDYPIWSTYDLNFGVGTTTPRTQFHVIDTTSLNSTGRADYIDFLLEDDETVFQIGASDDGNHSSDIVMSSGNSKHWIMSHRGPSSSNRFSFGYQTSVDGSGELDSIAEFLTLTTSGNVGIGTTDPKNLLSVGSLENGLTVGSLAVKTASDSFALHLEENSGQESWQLGINSIGDLNFYNSGSATPSLSFYDSGDINVNGNIYLEEGIQGFYLSGVNYNDDPLGYTEGLDFGGIAVNGNSGVNRQMFMFTDGVGGDNIFSIVSSSNSGSTWNPRFVVEQDGKVGIGENSPSQELDIIGDIELQETVSSDTGVIYKGSNRFIHNYTAPGSDGGNLFVGIQAGNFTMATSGTATNASYNTGVGQYSLDALTTGYRNSALGYGSLTSNTTGYDNSALGRNSLFNNTIGFNNSAFGMNTLHYNQAGNNNTAIGYFAGFGVSASNYSNNVFIGYQAGDSVTTGSNNIIIGYDEDMPTGATSNHLNIGGILYGDISTGNIGIGTASPSSLLALAGSQDSDLMTFNSGETDRFKLRIQGTGTDYLVLEDENDNTIISFLENGNVGIGITDPSSTLSVSGSANGVATFTSTDDTARIQISDNDTNGYINVAGSVMSIGQVANVNVGNLNIDSSGNVGIGTTSPDHLVHLVGSQPLLDFTDTGNDSQAGILFRNTAAVNRGYVLYDFSTDKLGFRVSTNGSGEDMTIDSDGNVGIGTDSPTTLLQVNKENAESILSLSRGGSDISANTAVGTLQFLQDYSGSLTKYGSIDVTSNNLSGVRSSMNFNVKSTGGSVLNGMTLYGTSAGINVGIGTTTPSEKLHIGGNIQLESSGIVKMKNSGGTVYNALYNDGADTYLSGFVNNDLWLLSNPNAVDEGIKFSTDGGSTVEMLIQDGGNVGIGTIYPGSKLSIVSDGSPGPILNLAGENVNQFESGRIRFTELGINSRFQGAFLHYDGDENIFNIGVHDAADTEVSNDLNVISIKRSTGNVGIGTTTPTGIFSVATSTGAEYLTVLENGNVGIGTVSPDSILNVVGDTDSVITLGSTSAYGGSVGKYGSITNYAGNANIDYPFILTSGRHPSTEYGSFVFRRKEETGTEVMVIDNDGNVGIGTTGPLQKLTVEGDLGIGNSGDGGYIRHQVGSSKTVGGYSGLANVLEFSNIQGSVNQSFIISDASDGTTDIAFGFDVNNSPKLTILGNGNVGIGTTTPSKDLEISRVGDATMRLTDTAGAGASWDFWLDNWDGSENYKFKIAYNDDEKMTIKTNGNVGIGTSSPDTSFHVFKNSFVGANFERDAGAGGSVIKTTNATGNYWITGTQNELDNDSKYVIGYNSLDMNDVNFVIDTSGNIGIGTTTPSGLLTVASSTGTALLSISDDGSVNLSNDAWLKGRNNANTNDVNIVKINSSDEIQFGGGVNVGGSMVFPTNSGVITAMDMPLDTSSPGGSAGDDHSYTFRIGSSNIMTIFGENDGAGALQNGRVGIGTINPGRKFDILDNTASAPQMRLTSDGSNYTEMYVDSTGDLSIKLTGSGGDDIIVLDENMKICSGGDFGSVSCPTTGFSLSGTGNLIVENKVVADKFERICPDGYIWVPGSAKYGTLPGFCVMKYEARNSGGLPDSTDPTVAPWVSISQETARAECNSLGEGYHLISEAEWMTIAENIANTTINDTDDDAGLQLATGHTDNAPGSALTTTVASDPVVSGCTLTATMENASNAYSAGSCEIRGDGSYGGDANDKGYYGTSQAWATTGYVSGAANKAQLRTHVLSNGEVIWDFSGNVYDWTDKISICDEHPYELTASTTSQWMEYTDSINYKGFSYLRPADDGWSATNGIGRIYTDIGDTASATRAFKRGGTWYNTSYAGVFSLDLNIAPTTTYTNIGFRCAQ
jgi:formylglycine-generating enzyme required for sulfatase activity